MSATAPAAAFLHYSRAFCPGLLTYSRGALAMFRGSITALITPFKDGKVDEKAYQEFIEWQIGEGTHGVVPCGTTGESPTLTHDEHRRVVELCVEVAKG